MLMLLLVLHASISYMVTPLGTTWPFKDSSTHMVFDIAGAFIHTFRLPLFFVMAGFFGAMLYHERGAGKFLKNRLQRIAIPLVVFWVVLAPLILSPFALLHLDDGSRTFRGLMSWLISADARSYLHFFHLWFLFDLLVYYAAILLLIPITRRVSRMIGADNRRKLKLLFCSPWAFLVFAGATAVSLLPMKLGMLESPATFARPMSTLLADAVFVLFGWGLYIRRDSMGNFVSRARALTLLGLVFFLAHTACVGLLLRGNTAFHLPSVVFGSLSIWLFVYGLIGLFIRYLEKPHRIMRYIADSSYWCYLVHLPLVAWLSFLLAEWRAHALVKYSVVLVTTLMVCLLTYDWFVRSTFVGVLINGRRRPSLMFSRKSKKVESEHLTVSAS
jgi:peptidoglycan/LPS O-acetylase OafA/YrhL